MLYNAENIALRGLQIQLAVIVLCAEILTSFPSKVIFTKIFKLMQTSHGCNVIFSILQYFATKLSKHTNFNMFFL